MNKVFDYPRDHRRRNPSHWEQMPDTFTVIVKTDEDQKTLDTLIPADDSNSKRPRTSTGSINAKTRESASQISTRVRYQLSMKLVFDKSARPNHASSDETAYTAYRIKVALAHSGADISLAEITAGIIDTFRSEGLCCHYAYCPIGSQNTRYYLTNQVIVHLVSAKSSLANLKTRHASPLYHLKSYNRKTHLFELPEEASTDPVSFLDALLEENKQIEEVEFNLISRYQDFGADTLIPEQDARRWHRDEILAPEIIRKKPEHEASVAKGHNGVTIAVIDYSFNLEHPDLKGQPGSDEVHHFGGKPELDLDPFGKSMLDNHGTACAGIIVGKQSKVDGQIEGIASGCTLLPIAFPLQADDDMMWELFDFASERADVISCSWGPPPVYAPLSRLMWDKLNNITQTGGQQKNGAVIVFAAGNFSAPLDAPNNHSFVWRDFNNQLRETRGAILNGEATHPAVITVAACTSENQKATYSNWGKGVTLCAPSNNAHPIDIHQPLPGKDVWTMRGQFTGKSRIEDLYSTDLGGTSVAAALVAGVAGLVFSTNPALSGKKVRRYLILSAEQISTPEPDLIFEDRKGEYAPRDQFELRDHSEWFGHGKVNAIRAIKKAR